MKKAILSLAVVLSITTATTITASAAEVVVKKGDTLWGIAQDHGVSVNYIKEKNNLTSNLIFPDQALSINEQKNQSTTNNQIHTVHSGDTLWGIGQANGVSVDALISWNNLNSNLIIPGQQLSVQGSNEAVQTSTNTNESAEQKAEADNTANESDQTSDNNAAKTMTMEATAYTADCEGCSGVTYTGIDLNANPDRKVIAVDPDTIPLGSEVYVEGYGKAIAGDIGGAIQGNRIDVFIPSQSDALDFGRKSVEVTVYQ